MKPEEIIEARRRSMAMFKLGMKASSKAVHRTVNRPPKGKGWVQGVNMPEGLMCRPDGVRESIEHYRKAYAIFPDLVILYQIALALEMIGELEAAAREFSLVRDQAQHEGNAVYVQGAEMALARVKR
jgi:tetratricopeptide (TPR) repeat protein